jgi:RNA polymerase sigma-70 factor (ECF subfamily)
MKNITPSPEEQRRRIARWVATMVLPHEALVRRWLSRSHVAPEDIDDVIQEAYCRLAMLESVDHIESPHAYFFSIARNLLLRRLKRQRLVPLEAIAEIDALHDDRPSPEQHAAGKLAYAKASAMIAAFPERCGQIVRLKKIEGWSQKQIAQHLGTTEKAVEKQLWLGLRLLREAWRRAEEEIEERQKSNGQHEGRH